MATLFQKILANAEKRGITERKTKQSIDWFRNNIRKTTKGVSTNRVFREEKDSLVNSWTNVGPGRMYFVNYDPKWKKELPYYDTFPLIIPIERYNDGVLGLNLHYLPPVLRAKLLDALYDTVNNPRLEENVKMKISYQILNSAAKFKEFEPCIKRYLGKHFRSRFIKIEPSKWTPAVFLPLERFEKASNKKVWADSRRKIRKRK